MEHPKSWQTVQFRAMGSQISLWLDTTNLKSSMMPIFNLVEELFHQNECIFSRFQPDSELSRLNRHAGEWVEVSLPMWNVLNAAVALAYATNGLFDPTILDALELAGYTKTFSEMATAVSHKPTPDKFNIQADSRQAIRFETFKQRVLLPAGIRIDLGGIAKGATAQQAVDLMRQWGPCLVDAGGDLTAGAAPYGFAGWPVAVPAPKTSSEPMDLFTLWLAEESLATSGIDYRCWRRNGRNAHHLIDPFTGQPADTDAITTTVLAKDATTAEAWVTAALIGGSKHGMARLGANRLPAAMVTHENKLILTTMMLDKLVETETAII